jgi:uncharacterized protein
MRRLIKLAVGAAVLTYLGVAGAIYALQDRLLYFPDTRRPDPMQAGLPEVEVASLATADGLTLNGWFKPARDAAPTVVVMHGNGDNIGVWGPLARPWIDAGLGVLLFDWRGYGGNVGTPNEAGLLADAEAAIAYLRKRDVPLERTVLYGESLGSGIAVQIAARHKVGALILHAPYTSVAEVAAAKFPFLPVGLLIRDRFDSLAAIGQVMAPVLVMHGERDVVIPVRFGRKLYAAIPGTKQAVWFPDGEHHNLVSFGTAAKALAFLRHHLSQ